MGGHKIFVAEIGGCSFINAKVTRLISFLQNKFLRYDKFAKIEKTVSIWLKNNFSLKTSISERQPFT